MMQNLIHHCYTTRKKAPLSGHRVTDGVKVWMAGNQAQWGAGYIQRIANIPEKPLCFGLDKKINEGMRIACLVQTHT